MRARLVSALLLSGVLGMALVAAADPAKDPGASSGYDRVTPGADGIGKTYMGREIAHVMGWQAAGWLERPDRENEERSDVLLRTLDIQPGMSIADVGAGTGYYSRRFAGKVGATGNVYAVEIQPEMLQMLKQLSRQPGLANIKPVLGTVDDVKLAPASIDLAIMIDVYHELEYPREELASIVRSLKPGGRVVFVEYRAEDPAVQIKRLHKMSIAQVKREALQQPELAFEKVITSLPLQHVIVFRKKGP